MRSPDSNMSNKARPLRQDATPPTRAQHTRQPDVSVPTPTEGLDLDNHSIHNNTQSNGANYNTPGSFTQLNPQYNGSHVSIVHHPILDDDVHGRFTGFGGAMGNQKDFSNLGYSGNLGNTGRHHAVNNGSNLYYSQRTTQNKAPETLSLQHTALRDSHFGHNFHHTASNNDTYATLSSASQYNAQGSLQGNGFSNKNESVFPARGNPSNNRIYPTVAPRGAPHGPPERAIVQAPLPWDQLSTPKKYARVLGNLDNPFARYLRRLQGLPQLDGRIQPQRPGDTRAMLLTGNGTDFYVSYDDSDDWGKPIDARWAVTRLPKVDPIQDRTIRTVIDKADEYAKSLKDALENLDDIWDSDESKEFKLINSSRYPEEYFEATSRLILVALVHRCIVGFCCPELNDEAKKAEMDMDCATRLSHVIDILRVAKTVCREILSCDNKITTLVHQPVTVGKTKISQKKVNDARKKTAEDIKKKAQANDATNDEPNEEAVDGKQAAGNQTAQASSSSQSAGVPGKPSMLQANIEAQAPARVISKPVTQDSASSLHQTSSRKRKAPSDAQSPKNKRRALESGPATESSLSPLVPVVQPNHGHVSPDEANQSPVNENRGILPQLDDSVGINHLHMARPQNEDGYINGARQWSLGEDARSYQGFTSAEQPMIEAGVTVDPSSQQNDGGSFTPSPPNFVDGIIQQDHQSNAAPHSDGDNTIIRPPDGTTGVATSQSNVDDKETSWAFDYEAYYNA